MAFSRSASGLFSGSSPGGSSEFEAGMELDSGRGLFNLKHKRDYEKYCCRRLNGE